MREETPLGCEVDPAVAGYVVGSTSDGVVVRVGWQCSGAAVGVWWLTETEEKEWRLRKK